MKKLHFTKEQAHFVSICELAKARHQPSFLLRLYHAKKLLPGQSMYSGCWLCPVSAPFYQSTRWLKVKHELQDWTDGPGRLGVSQPKLSRYS